MPANITWHILSNVRELAYCDEVIRYPALYFGTLDLAVQHIQRQALLVKSPHLLMDYTREAARDSAHIQVCPECAAVAANLLINGALVDRVGDGASPFEAFLDIVLGEAHNTLDAIPGAKDRHG